MGLQNYNEA